MRRVVWTLLLLFIHEQAMASYLDPVSYDMPNGYGQAAGGTYNYWDGNYTGSGNKTTDGSPLSGGLGALTDGVVTNQPWYDVSNVSGTGPYVGWTIDPTIAFHFAQPDSFSEISVHVDNSDVGGVAAPASISVSDGTSSMNFTVASEPYGSPYWINLNVSGLGLSGNTIDLTLHRSEQWVFVDEVQFQGAAVPEPSSLALIAIGLLLATWRWKSRDGRPIPA